MNYDINKIRNYFPVLKQQVYKKPLVYLDNAATTQKPVKVLMEQEKLHTNNTGKFTRQHTTWPTDPLPILRKHVTKCKNSSMPEQGKKSFSRKAPPKV